MADSFYIGTQGTFFTGRATLGRCTVYIQDSYTAGDSIIYVRASLCGGRTDGAYNANRTYGWISCGNYYNSTSSYTYTGPMTQSNYGSYRLGDAYSYIVVEPSTGKLVYDINVGVEWYRDNGESRSAETVYLSAGTQVVSPYNPTYTVSYNSNYGNSTPNSHTGVSYGSYVTLSSAITRNSVANATLTQTYNGNEGTPSKQSSTSTRYLNYDFNGWYSSYNGSTYSAGATMYVYANTTMTAQWYNYYSYGSTTAATATRSNGSDTSGYKFTYNANGGSCAISNSGGARTITYTMNGWYTAKSGGTKVASSGASFYPTATQTLYAQWSSSASTNAVTLPTATRNGYTFLGWSTSSTATTAMYTAGQSVTPTANTTLYAVWKPLGCVYIYTGYMA